MYLNGKSEYIQGGNVQLIVSAGGRHQQWKIYFEQAVCCHTWVIQTEGMEEESVSKSFVVNWQFVQLEMQ
jgi:hypothetical protein